MPVVTDAAALPARDDQRIGRQMRVDIQPRTLVSRFEPLQVEYAAGACLADEEHTNNNRQHDDPTPVGQAFMPCLQAFTERLTRKQKRLAPQVKDVYTT